MYEYNCKLVKVVDGDTIDVDIDLGFGVWLQSTAGLTKSHITKTTMCES